MLARLLPIAIISIGSNPTTRDTGNQMTTRLIACWLMRRRFLHFAHKYQL